MGLQETNTSMFYMYLEEQMKFKGYRILTPHPPPPLDFLFYKDIFHTDSKLPGGDLLNIRTRNLIGVLQVAKTTNTPTEIAERLKKFYDSMKFQDQLRADGFLLFVYDGMPRALLPAGVMEEIQKMDVKLRDGNITAGAHNVAGGTRLPDPWRQEIG